MADTDLERLAEDYYASLYRFALALARRESDAADLTQQTFYLWAAKGHQLRDPSKAKTWLFTSLYRASLAQKRREVRFAESEADIALASTPVPVSLVNKLDGATAQQALLAMPEKYRAPLSLFYLREHSYREIAEILDLPLGTVMSRISRGKSALRKLLLAESPNPQPPKAPPAV